MSQPFYVIEESGISFAPKSGEGGREGNAKTERVSRIFAARGGRGVCIEVFRCRIQSIYNANLFRKLDTLR